MCNLSDWVEEIGIKKGRSEMLDEQVEKKLNKEKPVAVIAEELEMTEEEIVESIERIKKNKENNKE